MGAEQLREQFKEGFHGSGRVGMVQDAARAKTLGDRFGKHWLSKLTPANDDGVLKPGKVLGRLDTISITETAGAFDNERVTIVREQIAPSMGIVEIWDATFDNTCPVCASLHGTKADERGFPGGHRPGSVHPRCQCSTHFEPTSAASNFNLLPYIAAGATYGWM